MKAAEFGDYSFSNFVVGECNSFAFKAAVSVTENLGGRNTNPMLIWGEPGQGKTHLLKAMASSICEKHPDKKSSYSALCKARVKYEQFGEDALLSKKGFKEEEYRVKPEYYDYYKNLYMQPTAPSAIDCWMQTLNYAKQKDKIKTANIK